MIWTLVEIRAALFLYKHQTALCATVLFDDPCIYLHIFALRHDIGRQRGRVVKALASKANGLCPREFKSRRCRNYVFYFVILDLILILILTATQTARMGKSDTRTSNVVSHHRTNRARPCLTSEIGRDQVLSR